MNLRFPELNWVDPLHVSLGPITWLQCPGGPPTFQGLALLLASHYWVVCSEFLYSMEASFLE